MPPGAPVNMDRVCAVSRHLLGGVTDIERELGPIHEDTLHEAGEMIRNWIVTARETPLIFLQCVMLLGGLGLANEHLTHVITYVHMHAACKKPNEALLCLGKAVALAYVEKIDQGNATPDPLPQEGGGGGGGALPTI